MTLIGTHVAVIAVTAFTAMAPAQNTTSAPNPSAPNAPPTRAAARTSAMSDFRTTDWLASRPVVNDAGTEIGDASDFIIDRGTGRVTHVVIRSGTTLGLGGRDVAIPYGALAWDDAKEQFVLSTSPEKLKTFPEFSADSWKAMLESPDSQSDLRRALTMDDGPDAVRAADPYAAGLKDAEAVKIEGRVASIGRMGASGPAEMTVMVIERGNERPVRVALGPSWFVNGGSYVPMRGDPIVVDAVALPRDPDQLHVALAARSGDRELRLRDADRRPSWTVDAVSVDDRRYRAPYWRYMLASSLDGSDVYCRGMSCGEVEDVILERRSGDVALLSIDPDEAILGIADTTRLIPWQVVRMSHRGDVRVDASKEMVLASVATPSDLKDLSSGALTESIYAAFDVPPPKHEARKSERPTGLVTGGAWTAKGTILSSVERDSARTLSGKVTDTNDVKFESNVEPATALELDTGPSGKEVVLLGPAWFMKNQRLAYKPGDIVTVEAIRAHVDGKPYWIAKSFEVNGRRVELIDRTNRPTWDPK